MRKYGKPHLEQVASLDELLKRLKRGNPVLSKDDLIRILQESQTDCFGIEESADFQNAPSPKKPPLV